VTARRILVLNPVGGGLHHYSRSLVETLDAAGAVTSLRSIDEPSASGESKLGWLIKYCGLLACARRRRDETVLITWPVLGYFDFLLARALAGHGAVIVLHDPEPLVAATGYGRIARAMAGIRRVGASALVHSERALSVVHEQASVRVQCIPHPMLAPVSAKSRTGPPQVSVLGQYKADRDVDVLRRIGDARGSDWRLRIVGRGWPPVAGWAVRDAFVTEQEFDRLIRDSDVVLIPYRRFFQSGVAVRCLEVGTAVVGEATSSLTDMLSTESAWLVQGDDWERAIDAALTAGPDSIAEVAKAAHQRALADWTIWVRDHA